MKRLIPWASCFLACVFLLAGCDTAVSSTKGPPPPVLPKGTASAGAGGRVGTILVTYHGHKGRVNAIAWSPDGKRLASGGQDGVQIWDAATGNQLLAITTGDHLLFQRFLVNALAWSPDGTRLVIAGGFGFGTVSGQTVDESSSGIGVWDATTGKTVLNSFNASDEFKTVAWSPDGKLIAGSGTDNTVQVWNATTGKILQTYKGHTNSVASLAWSPDSTSIASASFDNTVQVWNATTGKTLLTYKGHTQSVEAVAWAPDGKHLASGGADLLVQVWDAATGTLVFTYKGHSGEIHLVAWSPDGKRIVSGSVGTAGAPGDDPLQLWDAFTGAHAYIFSEGSGNATALAWSPDGTHIASALNLSPQRNIVEVWQAK